MMSAVSRMRAIVGASGTPEYYVAVAHPRSILADLLGGMTARERWYREHHLRRFEKRFKPAPGVLGRVESLRFVSGHC